MIIVIAVLCYHGSGKRRRPGRASLCHLQPWCAPAKGVAYPPKRSGGERQCRNSMWGKTSSVGCFGPKQLRWRCLGRGVLLLTAPVHTGTVVASYRDRHKAPHLNAAVVPDTTKECTHARAGPAHRNLTRPPLSFRYRRVYTIVVCVCERASEGVLCCQNRRIVVCRAACIC